MKNINEIKNSSKVFLIYKDSESNFAEESVWADKEGDYYRIKNIPFFANNIAYDDLISVEVDVVLYFDELIEESGHSTIQVVLFDMDNFDELTKTLTEIDCDWEGSHIKEYISIDVPKGCNYRAVKLFLEKGLVDKKWDYKEACISKHHKSKYSL